MTWRLWSAGTSLVEVADLRPRLASWNKSSDAAQLALQQYLDDLLDKIGVLPPVIPLALHLDVDVEIESRLLKHYDLENYLMPMFGARRLSPARFVRVSARKRVGGGSRLKIATATLSAEGVEMEHEIDAGAGSETEAWKARIEIALAARASLLAAGPVAAMLAFRCSSRRNWTTLWKPAGDALGPVLGLEGARRFAPQDGRIVDLDLHRIDDDTRGHKVEVAVSCELLGAAR